MYSKSQSQYEIMTQTPIPSLVIKLSIPTIITMLVTNIYNMADTAFVSQLGNSASGAVGIVFGFMAIIQAAGFMFGQGAGSLISRFLGAKDIDNASITASTGFFASLLVGVFISVVSFSILDSLVMMLGSTKTILPFAKTYILFILVAAPFMTASFVLNNILRYEGRASLGMIGMLAGAIINIVFDPILIFGFDMGIAGAGLATAFSQILSFCILLSMFLRGKTQSKISLRKINYRPSCIMNIIETGLPSLLRQGLTSITTVMLNSHAAVYGDTAVAAMSIVSRVVMLVFSVAVGIGQGFQPVSGFNYGAEKYSRMREAYRFTVILSEGVIIIATLVLMLISNNVIQVFRNDPTVIEIGTRALRLNCIAMFVLPACMITEMQLQSAGQKLQASILSSLRGGLIFIPVLLILAKLRGLSGIQEAQPVAFILACIPAFIFAVWFFKKLPKEDGVSS